MSATHYSDILEFWFGKDTDDRAVGEQKSSIWWKKDKQTDALIRDRFESTYQKALQGDLEDWKTAPDTRLALIILLDQFSRNMYRDKPEAFAADHLALELSLEGIELGMDGKLRPIQRVFFYMPMEHAEDLSIQHDCVAVFSRLLDEVDEDLKEIIKQNLDYAHQHLQIIERFGRFPHRNTILNRPSTEEETAFLQLPGSSF